MKTNRNPIDVCLLCAALLTAATSGAQPVAQVAGGATNSLFLKSDGSLWAMGYNGEGQLGDGTYNSTNRPKQIVAGGVTAVAGRGFHNLFLKSDGSLWAMGYNAYGQLGEARSATPQRVMLTGSANQKPTLKLRIGNAPRQV